MATYTQLFNQYREKHGFLKSPRQGFNSLHPNLWLAFSMVIARGYYDVGTYADKPGDHSWGDRHNRPGVALAFDVRRDGWVGRFGWQFRNAQKTAQFLWDNRVALNVDYVIVGQKIISRQHPAWRTYTGDTSHHWHIHVSGVAD